VAVYSGQNHPDRVEDSSFAEQSWLPQACCASLRTANIRLEDSGKNPLAEERKIAGRRYDILKVLSKQKFFRMSTECQSVSQTGRKIYGAPGRQTE